MIEQLKVIVWGQVHVDFAKVEFDSSAIQHLKSKLIQDLNKIIRCLEIYLAHCVRVEECSTLSVIKKLDIHSVLSFNYTNTYKTLYDD
jgi:hypothetical protein